jgi:hypothetical protein
MQTMETISDELFCRHNSRKPFESVDDCTGGRFGLTGIASWAWIAVAPKSAAEAPEARTERLEVRRLLLALLLIVRS